MKRAIYRAVALTMVIAMALTSCKKDDSDELEKGTELQQLSCDENSMQGESESLLTDFSLVAENSFMGKTYPISGATVNDSDFAQLRKIIISYDGDNADMSRHRKGTVTIELNTEGKWSDPGALMKITITKLMVTRKVGGKTVEFNGVFYLQNVSGGKLSTASTVVHKFWGGGITNFDSDATQRVWFINRKRTFENNQGVITVTTEGDTTVNGKEHVITWGFSRKGTSFTTQTTTPVVFKSTCMNGPISGVKVHHGFSKEVTVTFGVDVDGNPISSGCGYGLKVEWKNKKDEDKKAILAY